MGNRIDPSNNNIKPDMFIDINTLPYIIKPQVL